jgi:hypothetical protein
MDPETQRLWNAWADRRIQAALEAERERFEARLQALQVEIYKTVAEAFETSTNATTKFVTEAIERGIIKSAAQGEKLLVKFHEQVQATLKRREHEFGPRERETIN